MVNVLDSELVAKNTKKMARMSVKKHQRPRKKRHMEVVDEEQNQVGRQMMENWLASAKALPELAENSISGSTRNCPMVID